MSTKKTNSCATRKEAMRERLHTEFPQAFPRQAQDVRALALRTREAIIERLGLTATEDIAALRAALAAHARSPRYLHALIKGGARVNLDGYATGPVTKAEQDSAAEGLAAYVLKSRAKAPAAKERPKSVRKASEKRPSADKPAAAPAPTAAPAPAAAPVVSVTIRRRRIPAAAHPAA